MKIDFAHMEEKSLPNFKGGEGTFTPKMYTDEHNKIMRGRLAPGCSIGMHSHDTSSETIFILSGAGKVLENGGETPVAAGDCLYCPLGGSHSLVNCGDEDLIFYAVVPEHTAAH